MNQRPIIVVLGGKKYHSLLKYLKDINNYCTFTSFKYLKAFVTIKSYYVHIKCYIEIQSEASVELSDLATEAYEFGRQIVHRVHYGACFHCRRSIQQLPVTAPSQLYCKYF